MPYSCFLCEFCAKDPNEVRIVPQTTLFKTILKGNYLKSVKKPPEIEFEKSLILLAFKNLI